MFSEFIYNLKITDFIFYECVHQHIKLQSILHTQARLVKLKFEWIQV